MTTITIQYGPDDALAFAQAHLAHHAWRAIDDSINNIRNHLKHGALTKEQVLQDVFHILCDAQSRVTDDTQAYR